MGLDASLLARYWAKVEKHDPDCPCCVGCWFWQAATNSAGYGVIRLPGKDGGLILAHRLSLIIDGRDPGPLKSRHSCDTPICVNPAHLQPGTQAQNLADMVSRGRSSRGERNSSSKLTAADVDAIRVLHGSVSYREIGERFGVSRITVGDIIRGTTWRAAA